jgi:F-type H+-transporting ATPase subunit epsilon
MTTPHAEHAPERPPAGRLRMRVVTPEGTAWKGLAAHVVVPAHDGEVAIYPGHASFLGALGLGSLRIHEDAGATRRFYLEGGVVQVVDGLVTVLAERVLRVDAIDEAKARKDLTAALAEVPTDDEAFAERDHRLESARERIHARQGAAARDAEG